MSNNTSQTPAEVLITSAVKTVGKRDFLRTVNRLFGLDKDKKVRQKSEVSIENLCEARVKGDRTGLKVGRYVLFEPLRCNRREASTHTHLCPIHTNQVSKFGKLSLGRISDPIDDYKNIFGEL